MRDQESGWEQGKGVSLCHFTEFKKVKNRQYFSLEFTFKAPQAGTFAFATTPPYTALDL